VSRCDLCSSLLTRKLHKHIIHNTSHWQIKCGYFKIPAFIDIFIPIKLESCNFFLLFCTLFCFASTHYMYVIFAILLKDRTNIFGKTDFSTKRSNMPRRMFCKMIVSQRLTVGNLVLGCMSL